LMSALSENKLFVTRPRLHMGFLRAFTLPQPQMLNESTSTNERTPL
jgi:hypothetical protein